MRNTITKSLYERKLSLLIWFLSVFVFTFLIITMFPSLRDSFGKSLQEIPEGMEGLFGDIEAYTTLIGYIDLQVIAQMVFLTIIMGVIAGTALLAGKETAGTLQSTLAQPVSRTNIFLQSFAALGVIVAVGAAGLFAGTLVGAAAIGETLPLSKLLAATFMVWLITMFFASLSFSLGGIFGKKGVAGILTGFLAFVFYMLTALSGMSDALKKLDYASPFHYFNNPSVIKEGLDPGNIIVLTGCILLFFVVGWLVFKRRDIS